MANIHDYLFWRGDITLDERPFNDVDNLILASLSYLDFMGIVPTEQEGGSIELARACRTLIDRCGGDVTSAVRSLAKLDTRFVELLAHSRRFGPAKLSAYADEVDDQRSLQFAALQIDLPNGETYISYRGTDSTLVGWREDFMLSFEVTAAQREAERYLRRAIVRVPGKERSIRVGGHSKGGNLAEYAAVCCHDDLRDRIVRVYSNDGPGMAPEVMKSNAHLVLGERMKHIVPYYSMIGMLFADEETTRIIVASTGTGIGQHDPTTWQVTWSGMEEVPELHQDAKRINELIADWASEIPLDERERAVNEIFDALEAGGATRFDEITSSTEGLQQVLRALSNTDERTRDLAMAFVEGAVNKSMNEARKAARETMSVWRRNMQEVAESALNLLTPGDEGEGIVVRHGSN